MLTDAVSAIVGCLIDVNNVTLPAPPGLNAVEGLKKVALIECVLIKLLYQVCGLRPAPEERGVGWPRPHLPHCNTSLQKPKHDCASALSRGGGLPPSLLSCARIPR